MSNVQKYGICAFLRQDVSPAMILLSSLWRSPLHLAGVLRFMVNQVLARLMPIYPYLVWASLLE